MIGQQLQRVGVLVFGVRAFDELLEIWSRKNLKNLQEVFRTG